MVETLLTFIIEHEQHWWLIHRETKGYLLGLWFVQRSRTRMSNISSPTEAMWLNMPPPGMVWWAQDGQPRVFTMNSPFLFKTQGWLTSSHVLATQFLNQGADPPYKSANAWIARMIWKDARYQVRALWEGVVSSKESLVWQILEGLCKK
jgi:hypothetical protein